MVIISFFSQRSSHFWREPKITASSPKSTKRQIFQHHCTINTPLPRSRLALTTSYSQIMLNDANGVVHVSTPVLLLSAAPLLFIAAASHRFDLGLTNALIIGIIRSFVQLMILGMILHPIFVLGVDWPWVVGLCEYFVLISMNYPISELARLIASHHLRRAFYDTHRNKRVRIQHKIYLPISFLNDIPRTSSIDNARRFIFLSVHRQARTSMESSICHPHVWNVNGELYQWC